MRNILLLAAKDVLMQLQAKQCALLVDNTTQNVSAKTGNVESFLNIFS